MRKVVWLLLVVPLMIIGVIVYMVTEEKEVNYYRLDIVVREGDNFFEVRYVGERQTLLLESEIEHAFENGSFYNIYITIDRENVFDHVNVLDLGASLKLNGAPITTKSFKVGDVLRVENLPFTLQRKDFIVVIQGIRYPEGDLRAREAIAFEKV